VEQKTQEKLLTAEEFYRLPNNGQVQELVAGRIVSEPVPSMEHGRVAAKIVALLDNFISARKLGLLFTCDSGFILARSPDTVRGPDISFVSTDRLRGAGPIKGYFSGPPDLAIEVLSPHDRLGEVRSKVADYLAAGTPIVWVVDSAAETVTVYRSLLAPETLASDQELSGEDILPGFTLKVAELFECWPGPLDSGAT